MSGIPISSDQQTTKETVVTAMTTADPRTDEAPARRIFTRSRLVDRVRDPVRKQTRLLLNKLTISNVSAIGNQLLSSCTKLEIQHHNEKIVVLISTMLDSCVVRSDMASIIIHFMHQLIHNDILTKNEFLKALNTKYKSFNQLIDSCRKSKNDITMDTTNRRYLTMAGLLGMLYRDEMIEFETISWYFDVLLTKNDDGLLNSINVEFLWRLLKPMNKSLCGQMKKQIIKIGDPSQCYMNDENDTNSFKHTNYQSKLLVDGFVRKNWDMMNGNENINNNHDHDDHNKNDNKNLIIINNECGKTRNVKIRDIPNDLICVITVFFDPYSKLKQYYQQFGCIAQNTSGNYSRRHAILLDTALKDGTSNKPDSKYFLYS